MSLNQSTKIWVISLVNATSRRAQFTADNPGDDVAWSFFDAHDSLSSDLVYDEQLSRHRLLRPLRPGELGCYSSHVALWRWLCDSEFAQMIVFEDDIVIDWPFIAEAMQRDFASLGIDYLRFFAKIPSTWRPVASPFIDKYRHLIQYTSPALGTQGYLLTKNGARRLLAHAANVVWPIDVYMDRADWHGVLNLAVYPFPLYERFQPSSIGESRFGGHAQTGINSILRRLQKRLVNWRATYGSNSAELRRLRKRLKSTGN
jgi:glycosyl transferase family 25